MIKSKKALLLLVLVIITFLLSTTPAMAYTKTVSYRTYFRNVLGITVATHTGTSYWTYSGGRILTSSPHGKYNSWWTAPLYWVNRQSATWDWFNSSSGRSNLMVEFRSGISTPWGSINGMTATDRILTTVYGNGSYRFYDM